MKSVTAISAAAVSPGAAGAPDPDRGAALQFYTGPTAMAGITALRFLGYWRRIEGPSVPFDARPIATVTRPARCARDGMARTGTSIAIAALLLLGLAGCAAGLSGRLGSSASGDTPYVGVFTGVNVDGKPLYRFPSINVVGSRSSVEIN